MRKFFRSIGRGVAGVLGLRRDKTDYSQALNDMAYQNSVAIGQMEAARISAEGQANLNSINAATEDLIRQQDRDEIRRQQGPNVRFGQADSKARAFFRLG